MMKYGAAIGLVVLWLATCETNNRLKQEYQKLSSKPKSQDEKIAIPVIKEYDFGKLKLGDSIEYIFQVRNAGSSPVIVENVKASCGCTAVDWMKEPISPGQTGWIKSRVKPTDRGRIRKSVVAQLNTNDPFIVFYISGEVIASDSLAFK